MIVEARRALHGRNASRVSQAEMEEHGLYKFSEFRRRLKDRFEFLFSSRFVRQNLHYLLLETSTLKRRDKFRIRTKQFKLGGGKCSITRGDMVPSSFGDFDTRPGLFLR